MCLLILLYDFCTFWAVLCFFAFAFPFVHRERGVEWNESWDIWIFEQIDWRHKRYFPGYFLSSIILNIWKVQANYILHYNKIRAECAGQVVGDSGGFPKNFICFAATFSALHLTSPRPDSWAELARLTPVRTLGGEGTGEEQTCKQRLAKFGMVSRYKTWRRL